MSPEADYEHLFAAFAVSLAIGLLVGLERERHELAKAGLRTFALIALTGTLTALIAGETGSPWIIAATILAITAALAGAYFVDSRTTADDSGTTTVAAAIAVFCLGVVTYTGHWLLAVTLAVAITALLHFKPELEGISRRLTAQDIRSMIQFAILTAVILPLVPNEPLGPYGVLNPFQIWLIVLLISGVSLAGYVAWRLTIERGQRSSVAGALLTGALGGVVSSTATSVVYARHAKAGTYPTALAVAVIVLANAVMLLRVTLFTGLVARAAVPFVLVALAPAFLLALPALIGPLRESERGAGRAAETYRNPTNLIVALTFALGYAVVLVLAAWLSDELGAGGLYTLAFVSGLTDVDAITLSALQLFRTGGIEAVVATTAIVIAVASNLAMKAAYVFGTGGAAIGRATLTAFAGPFVGLALGIGAVYVFL